MVTGGMALIRTSLGVALIVLMASGCGGGGGDGGACDPTEEACVIEADVSTVTIGAGVEDEDTCQSWTLNNPTELWVNGISQTNDGVYHHANWFFVPDDQFVLPDGTWSCSEHNFSELVAALLGGYLFALSTQSQQEAQALPVGSAIRIPPYSRVIGSSHLLNAGDVAVTTTMHLAIHTIPPPQVTAKLAPARITYHDLHLDPTSRSSFTAECLFADDYDALLHQPFKYQLYYTLAHYHALGTYAELQIAGGPRDGEVIMRHDGYGENFGQAIEPPLDLAAAGALGVRFTCGFENPRAAEVGWGIGDQEMCVLALQAVTDVGFDAVVADGADAIIGTAPDGEVQHGGPCTLQMFPWDFTKPGGPPR
jgi:hypothetical protein